MLFCCPHCGHSLNDPIKDGIGSCTNCNRIFDTSPYNNLLGTCWYIRRNNVVDIDRLLDSGIQEPIALIALALTYDGDYSHDELLKIVDELGISKQYLAI